MLFTFAKVHPNDVDNASDAVDIIRVAAWVLAKKYAGCTAEVLSYTDGGNTVAVSLCMSPAVAGVECFEWFTQLLADKSLTLVRDERFERAMRQLRS
jgi:hypothetical protein